MTTQEIANRFSDLIGKGEFVTILRELFAEHACSIEPDASALKSVEGLENILKKGKDFHLSIEKMHEDYVSEILIAGKYFTCTMRIDATIKDAGRLLIDEVAVYKVENGKIVSEQFFY